MDRFDYCFDMLQFWLKENIPANILDNYLKAKELMRAENFEKALEILNNINIQDDFSELRYSVAINRAICIAVQSDVNGLLNEIVFPYKLQNYVNEKGEWSAGQIILFFNQAVLKTKMRMYTEAAAILEQLENLLSAHSIDLFQDIDLLTVIKSKLAWIYLDQNRISEFNLKLQELKNADYYFLKLSGMYNTRNANYREAQEFLRNALKIAPEKERLYAMFELARALEFTHEVAQVKESIDLYRFVFENAKDFELHIICSNNLGNAYEKLKQFKEAEAQFTESLKQREIFLAARPKLLYFEPTKIAIYDSMERTYRNMQKMYIAAALNEPNNSLTRQHYIAKALKTAERGRTVVFRDHIGSISNYCTVETMKQFAKEKNTVIVHYSYLNLHYDNMIYVYVIKPDQQLYFVNVQLNLIIHDTKLEHLIDYCTKIGTQDSTESNPLSAVTQLYSCLIRPIEKYIEKEKFITVVPHNVMAKAPFYALYDGKQFMIEKYIVHVALCASHLCSNMQESMISNLKHNLLLFANSELGYCAEKEATTIANICKKKDILITLADTTDKNRFLQQIDKTTTIIHIISHNNTADNDAVKEDKKHLGKIKFSNGVYVEHKDIRNLDLSNVSLAVLNICKACDGTISNDAPLGIYKAFLISKVPTVVGTLWDVTNSVASAFAGLFYEMLFSGRYSVDEACREAMLQIKKLKFTKPEDFQYWAPFVVVGRL